MTIINQLSYKDRFIKTIRKFYLNEERYFDITDHLFSTCISSLWFLLISGLFTPITAILLYLLIDHCLFEGVILKNLYFLVTFPFVTVYAAIKSIFNDAAPSLSVNLQREEAPPPYSLTDPLALNQQEAPPPYFYIDPLVLSQQDPPPPYSPADPFTLNQQDPAPSSILMSPRTR